MKKYILLWFIFTALLSGGIAFAHDDGDAVVGEIHPETQIGLPGSRMGHDETGTTTFGMTRTEVAALIHDTQSIEEKRSAIKLVLLFLFIIGLTYLYFPRRPTILPAAPADPTPPMPQTPPQEGREAHSP